MDPVTITTLAAPVPKLLIELLSSKDKRAVSTEAGFILETEPESIPRIRSLFDTTNSRLRSTWTLTIAMTVTLFALFVAMAVAAVVAGLGSGSTAYPIVFGGISASSLLTVILWKPYDKAFQATVTTQRLEMILIGLEEEWAASSSVGDPKVRSDRIRAANRAALKHMESLKP
ncbi:MAG: hypothetical protein FJ245_01940 [Nitrospira sp.]|nr:hypothetical protein [Nitrospira sp.]